MVQKKNKKIQTSPCGSHVVTNHSTKQAESRLTSLIGREEVHSWSYERLLKTTQVAAGGIPTAMEIGGSYTPS